MSKESFKLILKVAWFKNFLRLAIDQVSSNQHCSLTPYYFWPRTEAWEQLKLELDSKLWLTSDEKLTILKTAGEIMNYWLSYRNTKTAQDLPRNFKGIEILAVSK